eukprot:CAMPEP_0117669168 /NCGR_PEP_ID=MMETSP0804-20121206/11970_1 /TAXON_ID=1074897 /ORGANISM="Tetraselmis astigmatica, Strain CCMP880" /LENGTH=335 /DNA_ID=CAMNT_0005477171 /DNA_START=73 /DNA_END=1080 /DNA_ORIENTATION=+
MGGGYSKPKEVPSKHFPTFFAALPSMAGKVVCITGCTSGTGLITAKSVAQKGAEVVMLNRPSERATKAEASVKEAAPGAKVCTVDCDLQSLDSVRSCAEELKKKYREGIDVLCCNAGVMALPDEATKDGYDVQMQTNHLSHFLLTKELWPLLEKAAEKNGEARVVQHSSEARKMPNTAVKAEYYGKNGGNLGGNGSSMLFGGARWERYHQTKLANCVFTAALDDRIKEKGSKIKALVAHPGLAATNLQVTTSGSGGMGGSFTNMLMGMMAQSAEDGSMGILQCCCGAEVGSGELWGPKGFAGVAVRIPMEPLCTNLMSKKTLWEKSCEAVGEFTL